MSNLNLRRPFKVEHLPLVARLHKTGFEREPKRSPAIVRLPSRAAFYALRQRQANWKRGRFSVEFAGERRQAHFDAGNRQFAALYFDAFAAGYEPEVAAFIDAAMPDDGVFCDVGANWGYFSVFLASRPGFAGTIHAFEPWPTTFDDLSGVVGELRLGQTICCHNYALGEADSLARMTSGSHSGLASISGIAQDDDGISRTSDSTRQDIKVRPLDALDIAPSVIKIDAEGHEGAVLRGARRVLREHRPMLVFEHRVENERQWQNLSALELLESLGYRLYIPATSLDDEGARARFSLSPIDSNSRAMHAASPNLVACHVTRLAEILDHIEFSELSHRRAG